MKQFYNFLDSIKKVNPTLVEGIRKAHETIFEGLQTEEALDQADMALEINTEEKIAKDAPVVDPEPTPEETFDISEEDIPMDTEEELGEAPMSDEEEFSIEDLDELVPE